MPIIRMHSRDGLLTRTISLKALAIIILIFIPFLLSGITFSQATTVERTNSEEQHVSSNNPVFIAGEFQYFDLTLTVDEEKIWIIAYSGDSILDPHDRSVENYYRWEYDQGTWKDLSGHDSLYIKPSKCSKENNTYFFHIGIDHKANPGHWTIKVIVDEKEVSSTPSLVMISGFTFFLSAIIGVFEPPVGDKKYLIDRDFICSDRKRIMAESEENVDILVDKILSKPNPPSKKEKVVDDILDLSPINDKLLIQDELVKSTVTTYPKGRLKKVQTNELNSFFIYENGGEDNCFWKNKSAGYEKLLAMIVTIILLSIVFMPVINSNNTGDSTVITIINVQSYPVVGGKWVVMFNTIGRANLTITAVNGTTWSNIDSDYDLKFLEMRSGNKTSDYEWVNNSAFITNYSSNEKGYEISKILTNGVHTLMFRFGDDVAYAYNDASSWWNASWSSRKLITINSSQVPGDLTNFPVLVNITDTDLRDDAQNNGNDIVFTNSTGVKLNHEIESFNGTTGELFAWVNVTSLSSASDTEIYMYYGNSTSGAQENPTGVWDDDYRVVWHLNEDSSPSQDSTVNGNNGTWGAGKTAADLTDAMIGKGTDFDGITTDIISSSAGLAALKTISFWYNRDNTVGNWDTLFEGNPDNDEPFLGFGDGGDINDIELWYNGGRQWVSAAKSLDTWYYFVFISDGSNSRIYIDGIDESGALANYAGTPTSFMLGYESDSSFDGIIDEFRVSNTARSASWINTGYNNMVNQSTFISVDSEQNVTDTSVDTISTYTVTYSPYIITATAASGLNDVTLYYRYSTDNSSWGSNVSWNNESNPDTESPWEWNFNFSNGTGYYEFYGIGKLSGYPDETAPGSADAICLFNESLNTPPAIALINPSPNGTTGVSTQPMCQIWANDSEGDTLTVYWYENTTGSWVLCQANSSVSANSIVSWTYTQTSNYSTTYWWRVAVNDSMDNTTKGYTFTTEIIDTSVDTITPYTITSLPYNVTATGPSDLDNVSLYYRWSDDNVSWGWTDIHYDDFEDGWGNYTDGGGDCALSGNFPHQGIQSSRIRDNSGGTASMFYLTDTEDLATPGYNYLKVDFWFYANGIENGEDFWVQFNNGGGWVTVADYDAGDEFVNGQYYHEVVWINESTEDLTATSQVGFRCSASDNGDEIYIDQVYLNATQGIGNNTEWVIWSNDSNPDDFYPWNWNFDFANSTGYYEFYSIGNKSGSPNETAPSMADTICYYNPVGVPPTIDLVNPAPNGTTGVNLQPMCQIWANDTVGDTLTVYWYENTTGSWILRNTISGVSANSIVNYTFMEFGNYSVTYYWKVEVNDSQNNATAVYYFTTGPIQTSVDSISPYEVTSSTKTLTASGGSDLDNIKLYYRWSSDNVSWGTKDASIFDGFESGSMNSSLWDTYQTPVSDARIQFDYVGTTHSGSYSCEMDDNDADTGDSSLNELYAVYDFTGTSNINIDFWQYDADDEESNAPSSWVGHGNYDAVSFTNDGNTWYEIIDATSLDQDDQWTHYTYNISNDSNFNPNVNSNFTIKFQQYDNYQINLGADWDGRIWDDIYINLTTINNNSTNWIEWSNSDNPDDTYPWNWSFNFPNSTGYYEFYSIGNKSGSPNETAPSTADVICHYNYISPTAPVINSYNLSNSTGSKLNNYTGLLDVNNEYYFTINITDSNKWVDIEYIEIKAWYDNGRESTTYNQTQGGNLNMHLQYENTTGSASFNLLWPDDEVQLIIGNCTETIINEITRIINISFKPESQVRCASSNDTWNTTQNNTNDPYSWNFNITVIDASGLKAWKKDEYGVYKFTSILPNQDWVNVIAPPGFWDDSSVVTITYSSNNNFNMTIYFEENLTNTTLGDTISIANNVYILGDADSNDDITYNVMFTGIGEAKAIDIFNDSGIFNSNNISQIVNVQFDVYIPIGTQGGRYTARVATKIIQN